MSETTTGKTAAVKYKIVARQTFINKYYQWIKQGSTTYCNYFAQEVMRQMGRPLPTPNSANSTYDTMPKNGWIEITSGTTNQKLATAMAKANAGYPTIIVHKENPNGHIQVVVPNTSAANSCAQMGAISFFSGPSMNYSKYYTWRGTQVNTTLNSFIILKRNGDFYEKMFY